jgi:hypothetical protein
MPNTYEILIDKLDTFIRKFYLNKMIRGLIYFVSALFITYLLLNTLEYFLYLSSSWKTSLLFLNLAFLIYLFVFNFLIPLLGIYKLGKIISYKQAAEIIGKHFPHINDKIINTLQLQELAKLEPEKRALIFASIDQRIVELKPVPFVKAIDLNKNKKYLKFAIVPISIFIVLVFASPGFIKQGTKRILDFQTSYEKPAPFTFNLKNKNLLVNQGDELFLELELTGDLLPQDVYIHYGENIYKLDKIDISHFSYNLQNIQNTEDIYFSGGDFNSKKYNISVIKKPSILNYTVELLYPAYLKRSNERVQNIGDLSVPAGTKLTWSIKSNHTEKLSFNINNKEQIISANNNSFAFTYTALKNTKYQFSPIHPQNLSVDTLNYQLDVIPDQHPSIVVEKTNDSTSLKSIYFSGQIADDYGISKLLFISINKKTGEKKQTLVQIDGNNNNQRFFYHWRMNDLSLGEELDYYFEVYDNDGVNGAKKTRSNIMSISAPSEKQLDKSIDKNNDELKNKLKESIKKSEQIQKEAKKLNEKLVNQKTLRYEEKKQIQELIQKQKSLEEEINSIQDELKRNNELEKDFKQFDESIIEKKKQLEELFENVLDEKTKQMIKELEKLMEQNQKELSQEQLKDMQLENKALEKEMDRMLELFKQLEFDQKLNEKIDKLNELSKEQEKLSEESKNKNTNKEELLKKQAELKKEAEQLKQELKDLDKLNKEMEDPSNFSPEEEEMKDIEKQMDKGEEELGKNNKQKASDAQKDAAEKLKKLASKMKEKQMEGEEEELDLNIRALRQILENLVTASFKQESTMEKLKRTSTNDPQYVALTQVQKNIKDDMRLIEDSLFELSKKVVQIKSVINRETGKVNEQIERAILLLAERRTGDASVRQQYAMTSMNNLALLLTEILDQLQQEKNSKQGDSDKPGKKKGKKTGKGKSGQSISKMQEQLNKQIEQMKNGQNPGGQQGKGQQKGSQSEQLAKMAAQQQAIRNAMNQLEKEMNKNGSGGNSNQINQLKKEMEKTESDLYNRNINQETINRQKEIMTRLLEAEKAVRERELEETREAKQANENFEKPNLKFEEYKKAKMKELELIKTVPANLSPYYKEKVNQYFKQIP